MKICILDAHTYRHLPKLIKSSSENTPNRANPLKVGVETFCQTNTFIILL